jgi:hypothetical protein
MEWKRGKKGAANPQQNSRKWLRNVQTIQAGLDLNREKTPRWLEQFFKILECYWRYWRTDHFRCQIKGYGHIRRRPDTSPLDAETIEKTSRRLDAIVQVAKNKNTCEYATKTREYIKATNALLRRTKQ